MIQTLVAIAALQPAYAPDNTPEMQARGRLIRKDLADEVAALGPVLAERLGHFGTDFSVDASDGIGRKTEAPWVRFYSKRMSPTPREGFYAVVHFSADGSAFWVTVGCGSTIWNGGDLRPLPDAELQKRTDWARSVVIGSVGSVEPLVDQISLGAKAALPRTFEKATAMAKRFEPVSASESDVVSALLSCANFLRLIYEAQSTGAHLSPAVVAEMDLEELSRPNRRVAAGQGFGLSGPERRAIELRAMEVAGAWLKELGYQIKDTSQGSPFDFLATKGAEVLKVEVKGTTASECSEFFMTRNEVELHKQEQGATALALVAGIRLHRQPDGTSVAGEGVCVGSIGWNIDDCNLTPMAYRVSLPS